MGFKNKERFFVIFLLLCVIITGILVIKPVKVSGWDTERVELNFNLLTLNDNDSGIKGGSLIKSYLEAVGFKINHRSENTGTLYPKIDNYGGTTIRPYDLIYMMESSTTYIPTDLYLLCHSNLNFAGGRNIWAFHNTTLDYHLDSMFSSTIDQVQYHVYQQQAILAEEVPYVHVLYKKESIPLRHGINGLIPTPKGIISSSNPLTALNIHNTTDLPANRSGTEWVMRYPSAVREGNQDGLLYYQSTTGRTAYVDRLLWEPLVIINKTGDIIPWLAESFSVTPDMMTYSFNLRENITWHDGKTITPGDVKFSFDYIKSHELDANNAPTFRMASCTLDPDGTINIHMDEFNTWGIYDFLNFLVFPEHVFESVPYNDASWHDLTNITTKTGSGPYKFIGVEAANPPSWWKFSRNEDYWFSGGMNTSLTVDKYPRMENFTIRVIYGGNATVEAIKGGEIDLCRYFAADITDEAKKYPDNIDIVNAPVNTPSIWRNFLYINNQIFPLSDKTVRQAIAYALDYDTMVEEAERGYGIPVYNQYLPEIIHGTWHDPSTDIFRYNVTKSNQLLDDAGFLDTDGDGIREVPPNMTESTTNSGNGTITSTAALSTGFLISEMLGSFLGTFIIFRAIRKNYRIYSRKNK
ncbi:MAG: ABC transporter substrate-binding protein [Candidatus Hodarchaeales archaeon]|jgi:ABC-type transport system substrate-binding protein